jgi:hypothetical protein
MPVGRIRLALEPTPDDIQSPAIDSDEFRANREDRQQGERNPAP